MLSDFSIFVSALEKKIFVSALEKNRGVLGQVDKQGRISVGVMGKDFLGLQPYEYVYVLVEATGKFSRKGLSQLKPIIEEKKPSTSGISLDKEDEE